MADNMEGESGQNPTNTQPEKFIVKEKKWGSYLLEFLLLFLAVFLGFVAENVRESSGERETEKQYMKTMVEDLKSDTARLTKLIAARKKRIIQLDSLFELIASDRYIKEGNKVYRLYDWPYLDILRFFPSDRTIQQLKSSGNYRLIRKENVAEALINYDISVRNLKEYESLQVDLANQINQFLEKLIDPVVTRNAEKARINQMIGSDSILFWTDSKLNLPPNLSIAQMDANSKQAILKYINQIISLYAALRRDNILEKTQATKTLDLIVREYGSK